MLSITYHYMYISNNKIDGDYTAFVNKNKPHLALISNAKMKSYKNVSFQFFTEILALHFLWRDFLLLR